MVSRYLRRAMLLGLLLALTPGVASAAPAPYVTPAPTGLFPPANPSPAPFVTGSAQVGGALNGYRGSWADDPNPASEWLRCNATAQTCETTGDTDTRYEVTAADVGLVIVLRVVGRTRDPILGTTLGTRTADAHSNPIAAAPTAPTRPSNAVAPSITGDAREGQVVGVNLGQWTGSDPIRYSYEWASCSTTSPCKSVSKSARYRVKSSDVGHRLLLAVTATNAAGAAGAFAQTGTVAAKPATSRLKRLSPFPVMLIDGRVAGRITRISTLRLRRVPGGATIGISCKGSGCPYRRKTVKVRKGKSRTVAFKRLRRMRSGTVLVFTVRKGNTLGKYIRLRFRRNAAPSRVDRCVAPGSSKPVACS